MSETSTALALSAIEIAQVNHAVATNNLTNGDSVGFQSDKTIENGLPVTGTRPVNVGSSGLSVLQSTTISFPIEAGTRRDLSSGGIQQTGDPLHFAISDHGPEKGYFAVQSPEGEIFYTRAGTFAMNADRQLVNLEGFTVLSSDNAPMTISGSVNDLTLTEDNLLMLGEEQVGTIGLFSFANEALEKVGGGLYAPLEEAQIATSAALIHKSKEGSNTKPVLEVGKILDALQTVQFGVQMIQAQDKMTEAAASMLLKPATAKA